MTNSRPTRLKLPKSARLCSVAAIDALFASGKGALAYPLRLVALPAPPGKPTAFFISVPKKRLRHAVDRVCMRRRIREAYRLNRDLLDPSRPMHMAIIYVADSTLSFERVETALVRLLSRLSDEPTPKTDC